MTYKLKCLYIILIIETAETINNKLGIARIKNEKTRHLRNIFEIQDRIRSIIEDTNKYRRRCPHELAPLETGCISAIRYILEERKNFFNPILNNPRTSKNNARHLKLEFFKYK